jgi:GNAT superfamily N-acetyltransferase
MHRRGKVDRMEVRRIQPDDDAGLAASTAVLQASDRELWPDLEGFDLTDIRAFARFEGSSRRFEMVAAFDDAGNGDAPDIVGVGLMEFPLSDNLHAVEVTVAVHPAHRRRGVGTAIVEGIVARVLEDGRRTLNSIVDVPVALAATHASVPFARSVGFEPTLGGNTRHLHLPPDEGRLAELRAEVRNARAAEDYRTLTFEAPWPAEFVDDQCELLRVMSTDEPAGDGERQEERWDAQRLAEYERLRAARAARKFVAVAQHVPSGRLVACSEILVSDAAPAQAWQLITVVHPAHRGHRLGLAVKIANLDFLSEQAPAVRVIVTGNAKVNAPMIAVNEMMGFVVAGEGYFWQRQLTAAPG